MKRDVKRCPSCGDTLPFLAFALHRGRKDGRQSVCKECHNTMKAVWVYDNPEKSQGRSNRWAKENPAKHNERVRRWRVNNPIRIQAINRRWAAKNPEKHGAATRRGSATRRARDRNAFVEYIDHRAIYKRDGGVCQICLKPVDPEKFHIDHIRPLAKGGKHVATNVQLAHPRCNLSKGAKYGRAA